MECRAVWRCRSPRRKDALVSDFAVCARYLDRYSKRRSAWKKAYLQAVPFGGRLGSAGFRGTEAPRIPASPWAPTSRLVRVGIGCVAGRIRRGSRFVCAVRA